VIGIHKESDGKVRSEEVKYKIPGEIGFRITTHSTSKLIMVVPSEEEDMGEEEDEKEDETSRLKEGTQPEKSI
jgi:hypothetical protein